MNINNFSPQSGRMIKEDNTVVNIADTLVQIADNTGGGSGGTTEPTSKVITTTIASDASVSSVIDISSYHHVAIIMPAAWTAADIAFVGSDAATGTFAPIVSAGEEIKEIATAGNIISISDNALALAALPFIKICSGPSTARVNQAAARELKILLKK